MNVVRYSAAEQFGVPIYDPEALDRGEELIQLLGQYSIEPAEVPVCKAVNITPYYLHDVAVMHNFISRTDPDGPVVIEHLPVEPDTAIARRTRILGSTVMVSEERQTIVPTTARYFALVSDHEGPRYNDTVALHELIFTISGGQSAQ